MSETSTNRIEDLRWVRAFSPDIIPRYLVEQIKDKEFDVDDFFKFQSLNCMMQGADGAVLNPLNHLYVLADKENMVKGFLWAVIDPLGKDLVINTYSVDKDYWYGGKSVKLAADHVKELFKKLDLNKVFWITRYPKHSERFGFKRSRNILMEYPGEDSGKNTDGKHPEKGECRSSDSPAKGNNKSNS